MHTHARTGYIYENFHLQTGDIPINRRLVCKMTFVARVYRVISLCSGIPGSYRVRARVRVRVSFWLYVYSLNVIRVCVGGCV